MSLHAIASRASSSPPPPAGPGAPSASHATAIDAALARLPLRYDPPDDPRRSRLRWAIADILAMPCGDLRLEHGLACCTSRMGDASRAAMLRAAARVEAGAQVYVAAVNNAGARFSDAAHLRFAQKLAAMPAAELDNLAQAVFTALRWGPSPEALASLMDALRELPYDERLPLAALAVSADDYGQRAEEPGEALRALHTCRVLDDPRLIALLRANAWQHPGRAARIAAAARDRGALAEWVDQGILRELHNADDYEAALPLLLQVPARELDAFMQQVKVLVYGTCRLSHVAAIQLRHRLGEAETLRLVDSLRALPYSVAEQLWQERPTPAEAEAFLRVVKSPPVPPLYSAACVRALLRLLRREPDSVPERVALAREADLVHRNGSEASWLMICLLPRQHLAAARALSKQRGVATLAYPSQQHLALAEIIREVRSPATRVRDAWRRAVRGVRLVRGG